MARKDRHYETAFQDYLRSRGIPFCPVNETKKAIFCGDKIKSFDFLVYPGGPCHWLTDVKGRQFPYVTSGGAKRYWENWVTREDLQGLNAWQAAFGEPFKAYFVFAYLLRGRSERWPAVQPHFFNNRYYAFVGVPLDDYERHCRERSDKWQTLTVPTTVFREIIQPVEPADA